MLFRQDNLCEYKEILKQTFLFLSIGVIKMYLCLYEKGS